VNLSLRLTFRAGNASAKFFQITRLGKPEFTVEGIKFDLVSVNDDRLCLYDQHAPTIISGAGAQAPSVLNYPVQLFFIPIDAEINSARFRAMFPENGGN
jgi:hypothetical protein